MDQKGGTMRLVGVAGLLALAAAPLAGSTLTVNSTADQIDDNPGDGICHTSFGTCTLRAAVMEANQSSGATIVLPAGHYEISIPPACTNDTDACGDLNVTASMTITGAGAATTLLDANGLGDGIFSVESPATVTITGVTLENSSGIFGAAYVASGAGLAMIDSRITGCSGGGFTALGTAALIRTTIDSCIGHGAIFVGGTATLTSCTLSGNSASQGGAISTGGLNPLLILRGTTVSGNSATGFRGGGGLYLASTQLGGTSSCMIVDSTISGNSATLDGAGIYNGQQSDLSIYSSTITDNHADSDLDGSGSGGGIYNGGNGVSLRETILAGNWESAKLGSFYIAVQGECHGTLTTDGDNIVYPDVNCSVGTHYTQSDPKLAGLADNGGLTMTHLPAADGAAFNAGASGCVDESLSTLTVDQRGVVRPIGLSCDLGAVELEPEGDVNGDGSVDVADVFYLVNFLFAGGPVPKGRANVNGDSSIDVADVFYLINYLFAGGPPPA